MELNIYLAPPSSWGLGHLLSGDLWPTYCGVTSSSNATCCVRYIWQEIRLYCTCWMEETCSSILIRLNSAKCMAILSLPHWFCVQMSTEHWAWDVPFSKALQMWWLIQPRSSWEITCEENSWPMRNSWWERERESERALILSSFPIPPNCSKVQLFHVACQEMSSAMVSQEALSLHTAPCCFCFPCCSASFSGFSHSCNH